LVVSDSGVSTTAITPAFSPDGTLLAFSDGAQGGRAIVVVDFDQKSRKASNPRTVATHSSFLAWPFIVPDNRAVIFSVTTQGDFSGGGAGVNGITQQGPSSDLAMVDLKGGKLIWLRLHCARPVPRRRRQLPVRRRLLHRLLQQRQVRENRAALFADR
jgi:Tol biopolymer transport system component